MFKRKLVTFLAGVLLLHGTSYAASGAIIKSQQKKNGEISGWLTPLKAIVGLGGIAGLASIYLYTKKNNTQATQQRPSLFGRFLSWFGPVGSTSSTANSSAQQPLQQEKPRSFLSAPLGPVISSNAGQSQRASKSDYAENYIKNKNNQEEQQRPGLFGRLWLWLVPVTGPLGPVPTVSSVPEAAEYLARQPLVANSSAQQQQNTKRQGSRQTSTQQPSFSEQVLEAVPSAPEMSLVANLPSQQPREVNPSYLQSEVARYQNELQQINGAMQILSLDPDDARREGLERQLLDGQFGDRERNIYIHILEAAHPGDLQRSTYDAWLRERRAPQHNGVPFYVETQVPPK